MVWAARGELPVKEIPMNLEEAHKLRQELEAIEATMERITTLWLSRDFPSPDRLAHLAHCLDGIRVEMAKILNQTEAMPTEDIDSSMQALLNVLNAQQ
jgi:hypothetical protein